MDEAHEKTQKDLEKLEKKLARQYRRAREELKKKFYENIKAFDKADKEMARRLADGEITKDQYLQWRLNAVLADERVRQMRNAIINDLAHTDEIAAQMINDTLPIAYMDNVNYAAYEAESQSGLRTSFTLYSRETVERLMRDNPEVIPQVHPDVPKDERWNRQKLNSALTQGILQGDSIPHIADRLGAVADMDRNAAIRNARTYTTAAENGGRIDSYQRYAAMGIKMKQEWMAALDTRTRSAHRQLDGVKVNVGEAWQVDGYELRYPGDPEAPGYLIYNCRCTVVGDLDGVEDEASKRWSKLPEGMSYDEWKKAAKPKTSKKAKTTGTDTDTNISFKERIEMLKQLVARDGLKPEYIKEAGDLIAKEIKKDGYIAGLKADLDKAEQEFESLGGHAERERLISQRSLLRTPQFFEAGSLENGFLSIEQSKYFKSIEEAVEYRARAAKEIQVLDKKINDINDKLSDVERKRRRYNMPDSKKCAENLFKKLSEIREMGVSDEQDLDYHLWHSKIKQAEMVKYAYGLYPTRWVEQSLADGRMIVAKYKRGYYNPNSKMIAIDNQGDQCAIHEIAHRFEYTIPSLIEAEREFYERRTMGEPLKWLGPGYRRDEKSRKDDFISPYMGKDYGGSAYELISMGFEYAYFYPTKLGEDPDMESWIYGLLALAGE